MSFFLRVDESWSSSIAGVGSRCGSITSKEVVMADLESSFNQLTEMGESISTLLRELVAHLRESRTQLRQEWARRITEAKVLTAMSADEGFNEATGVYDRYGEAVGTGSVEAVQAYRRHRADSI